MHYFFLSLNVLSQKDAILKFIFLDSDVQDRQVLKTWEKYADINMRPMIANEPLIEFKI